MSLNKKSRRRDLERDHEIFILLTRYPDLHSRLFRYVSRNYYTHVSIGLDMFPEGEFYSFVLNGFRIENPDRHPTFNNKEVECCLYKVKVTKEVYEKTKKVIERYVEKPTTFRYNTIGLVLSLLRITSKRENCYFCSQFVSEVLEHGQVLKLKKDSSLYLPDDFLKMEGLDLAYQGTLKEMLESAFVPNFATLL